MSATGVSARGPLRVHPDNPRYFTDGSGRAVYLAGSHTWANLVERGIAGQTPDFDYERYLDFLEHFGHNFTRLWTWEHAQGMQFAAAQTPIRYAPLAYARTGPGKALDGKPKFDLTKFNPAYFDRLRRRVEAAGARGIYVAVMLFQGFSIEQKLKGTEGVNPEKGNPWEGHPYHPKNNVNGIGGDQDGDGEGEEVHTLEVPAVTRLQEAYVRKVIDTVCDLDNVLWEISNESHGGSTKWQHHFIRFVHAYEKDAPKQHPVGMTGQYERLPPDDVNRPLFESPAEWVSPRGKRYLRNPPAAEGRKVIVVDNDHIEPFNHDPRWVWKNFLRGHHFILMDKYMDIRNGTPEEPDPAWDPIRRAMGQTVRYANRMNLAAMVPRSDLASTEYCLAHAGSEYLVYVPDGGTVTVDLSAASGKGAGEWFNPQTGNVAKTDEAAGGAHRRSFTAPFPGAAVLYAVFRR